MKDDLVIVGAHRRTGKAASTGRDYDMANLVALTPLHERGSQSSRHTVSGFESLEYSMVPDIYTKLHGKQFPIKATCTLETRQGQNGAELFVVDVQLHEQAKAS